MQITTTAIINGEFADQYGKRGSQCSENGMPTYSIEPMYLLVLLSCSFSLPVLGNQLLLLSDAVDWFLTPTARRFSKGSNHSLFVTLLIS